MDRILSFIASAIVSTAPLLAQAQLRLPSLSNLPNLSTLSLPNPGQLTQQARRDVAPAVDLTRLRQQRIGEMLRQRSELIEADPAGEPMVRSELVLSSPSESLMTAARGEGFTVSRERTLDSLDLQFVTVRAPTGWDTPRALRRLQELDPKATVDFNHLYLESGELGPRAAARPRKSFRCAAPSRVTSSCGSR